MKYIKPCIGDYSKSEDKYYLFEYVLFDEENKKVAYVYNKFWSWSDLNINEKYLPKGYEVKEEEWDEGWIGYNMYSYCLDYGDSYIIDN